MSAYIFYYNKSKMILNDTDNKILYYKQKRVMEQTLKFIH